MNNIVSDPYCPKGQMYEVKGMMAINPSDYELPKKYLDRREQAERVEAGIPEPLVEI